MKIHLHRLLALFLSTAILLHSCGGSIENSNDSSRGAEVFINEEVENISWAYAEAKGRIGDPDNPALKDFGICYATHALPSTDDLISEPITGFEFFFCHLYDLEQNTTYYLRSFLTFDDGTVVYSDDQISFTTEALTHACSPPPNNIWGIDFSMSINDNTWGPNEFEIKGQGATSDLSIEFRSEPRSGVYLTAGESTDIEWSDQCAITLVRGQGFIARQLQRVDVENLGNGVFNITFCDLEFLGNSANFTSDGCIMLE